MKAHRAHPLPLSTQRTLARAYLKAKSDGARISYESVAESYNCTPNQARNAVRDYKSGVLDIRPGTTKRASADPAAADRAAAGNPDSLFEEEFQKLVLDVTTDPDLRNVDRVVLLEKLARTREVMQKISILGHLKKIDQRFLKNLVRRFMPEASDEDILRIIMEELEACKISP